MHTLDALTATQIAAGPSIDRPAAVIRELIENAIDAGARHIDITLQHGTMTVNDDGCGMTAEQLTQAFQRHTTSKLHQYADIFALNTLGFRGEALAAIAAVARVSCTSRTPTEPLAHELRIAAGEIHDLRACAHPVGTTVQVERLFYTAPHRRQFLRQPHFESQHIADLVLRYAFIYPEIAFRLHDGDHLQLQSSGSGNLAHTIAEIWHTTAQTAVSGQLSDYAAHLQGFVVGSSQAQPRRRHQVVAINRRPVRVSGMLAHLLDELVPPIRHQHAALVLHFQIPSHDLDVNAHIHKHEPEVRYPGAIAKLLYQALRATPTTGDYPTVTPRITPPALHALGRFATLVVASGPDGIYVINPTRLLADSTLTHLPSGALLVPPIPLSKQVAQRWRPHRDALAQYGFGIEWADEGASIHRTPAPLVSERLSASVANIGLRLQRGDTVLVACADCWSDAWLIEQWRQLAQPWEPRFCHVLSMQRLNHVFKMRH